MTTPSTRIVKKLETSLTAAFTTPPLPKLRLACCPPHHAYSTPRERGTNSGRQTHGLEDLAGIHHGDGRPGTVITQRVPGDPEPPLTQPDHTPRPAERRRT